MMVQDQVENTKTDVRSVVIEDSFPLRDVSWGSSIATSSLELGESSHAAGPKAKYGMEHTKAG